MSSENSLAHPSIPDMVYETGDVEKQMYEDLYEWEVMREKNDEDQANQYYEQMEDEDRDAYERLVIQESKTCSAGGHIFSPLPSVDAKLDELSASSPNHVSPKISPLLKKIRLNTPDFKRHAPRQSNDMPTPDLKADAASVFVMESKKIKCNDTERLLPVTSGTPNAMSVDSNKTPSNVKMTVTNAKPKLQKPKVTTASKRYAKRPRDNLNPIDSQIACDENLPSVDFEDDLFTDEIIIEATKNTEEENDKSPKNDPPGQEAVSGAKSGEIAEAERLRGMLKKLEVKHDVMITKLTKKQQKEDLSRQKKQAKLQKQMAKQEEAAIKKAEQLLKNEEKKQLANERLKIQREMLLNKQKRAQLNRSKLEQEELALREEKRLLEEQDQQAMQEIEQQMWQDVLRSDIPEIVLEAVPRTTHMQNSGTILPLASCNYSTFLITLPAKELINMRSRLGDWFTIESDIGVIDKYRLHDAFRKSLKGLHDSIPPQYRWDWNGVSTAVFVERPLNVKETETLMEAKMADHLVHAHIVVTYDGSQKRGLKGSQIWDSWFHKCNLPTVTSVFHDQCSLRPLKDARSSILSYVLLPKKGFVDLNPSYSEDFIVPSGLKASQYRELVSLQKRPSEGYAFKEYILSLEKGIPDSASIVADILDAHIRKQDALHHENRESWRESYYTSLPFYQHRKYLAQKFSDQDDGWAKYRESLHAGMAEKHRSWSWFDFLIDALGTECQCFKDSDQTEQREEQNDHEEEAVCLECEVGEDRSAHLREHIMGSKTEDEIKDLVKDSSMYEGFKRAFKYRAWAESEYDVLGKLSRHLFALMTKTRKYLPNRRMNCHITGPKGDSGKTAVLMMICGIFKIPPYESHLIHTVSNHKFLLNVKNSKLYKIRCLNDLSVDCLSGSQLKSLFESDSQAGNVKQGHIQWQADHPPVFVTSNLSNKSLFLKAKKESGNSCQISSDDYMKLLNLEEGRVGTELIMDLPIPKMWQRRYAPCRRCCALTIRWLLGVHLSGPSKIKSYGPQDFYDNSDKDSDGETARYPEHKSKIKVIKSAMGMKKVNGDDSKQMMLISQKDIDRLARLEQMEAQLNREVKDKDHVIRKVVEEEDKKSSPRSVNSASLV